jgi:RHS repeat-associated protein
LLSITDANSHETSFTYDAFGRVTQTNFPSSQIETYAYDANNNLTRKTDRKGQSITYVYDALNRLTKKQYPDSTEVDYLYDLVGKIQSANDPTGTYAFAYDNDGRLIGTSTSYSFLTSRDFTTSYGYDDASNRTSFTDPEGGSTTYAYDTLNRLMTLTPPSAFTTGSFGFSYDALSRRTQMTRPNSISSNYTYDDISRLLTAMHQLSGNIVDGESNTWDSAGNRRAKTDQRTGVTSNYGYDSIYRLLNTSQGGSTTESYTYDQVGNRTSSLGVSSYSNNSSNELTSTSNASFTYDANGNMLSKTDSTGTTSYSWDFENRLSSVTLPGAGGTVIFKYDPFGRRIYKTSSAATSVFAYDGDNLVEETNAAGGAIARYSQGLNIDEPLAMLRSATTSYYEADGLGSVSSITNSAGGVIQTYAYDSFGYSVATTGSLTNPFRYTGREFDTETGLYFYRARYYDPTNGRFLSEDPIGFDGGVNLYSYASNSPINWVDPTGQSQEGNIANVAQKQVGSKGYLRRKRRGPYGPGTNKCNQFVADAIADSGIPRPKVPYTGWRGWLGLTRDPTAHEWADPSVNIPGWSAPLPISAAEPGNVIAQEHGDWGHSGIVVAPGQTASVNSTTNPEGIVTQNDWGFRPRGQNGDGPNDPPPVVRQYTGP